MSRYGAGQAWATYRAAVQRGEPVAELAVEAAVGWLDEAGYELEARDLAVATDPDREARRAAADIVVRWLLGQRGEA